jgi:HD-GYP domain-containing protein (c-di-GMP phosphodiesterase class II)
MIVSNSSLTTIQNPELLQASAEQVELSEQLLAIGTALSSSQDLEQLLGLILSKSREITCSDAGSLYLLDGSDGISKLLFKVAQNDSQPSATFREFAMPLTRKSLAGYVALTGESLNLPDAYNLPTDVPYNFDSSFDRDFDYETRSVLVLPMQNKEGDIIGVLQLINRKVKPDAVVTPSNVREVTQPYSEWDERIVRSLASMAAISIERNQLQESIENLFEGFVKASVQLIEQRDPTTYGHSERVAELSVCLSQAVNSATTGSLQSIHFSDRQIQEIRYAALLHDFGEVCVPEAILRRLKKLTPEQLEVIRQRFAVARRTLEMDAAEAKVQYLLSLSTGQPPHSHQLEQLDTQLAQSLQKLNRYWELLLEANEPESLVTRTFQPFSDEDLALLTQLSQYTYRDIDGELKHLVSSQEMTHLMIPRGNLTREERLVIESHVTHSYQFLQGIPWTKQLKDIPNIVWAHHEKLDGTGYPQGLKQENIPIQSQILAIADIYDALTAGDRPYKQKLSPDTTLQILKTAAAKNKINPELVDLFEQHRVFEVLNG